MRGQRAVAEAVRLSHGGGGGGAGGFGGFGGFGGGGFSGGFGDFGDIFDTFFGGGGRSQARRNGPEQGADLRMDIELTFEEAAFGVEKELKVPRMENCTACGGKSGNSAAFRNNRRDYNREGGKP